ncbi:MAG: type II toxin-antitoxin system VapC family toxin [Thermodesulfobacteriota bacterium]
MITAVDTNVLVDVFRDDPAYCPSSSAALRRCLREGRLAVCDVVWAELAALFESAEALEEKLDILRVEFLPLGRSAATLAGRMWRRHRERGGARERVVADFLVGAHARVQCDRLLTRDRGFYRSYFAELKVLDPAPKG